MAQAIALNKELIACQSPQEILSLIAATPHALTKMAGGGALNTVNFSTALHRMARQCSYNPKIRKQTLADPRFALFLCSLTEAMAGMDYTTSSLSDYKASTASDDNNNNNNNKSKTSTLEFSSRECSNIAWSIAKIRIAPPLSALPVNNDDNNNNNALVETSLKCRNQVLQSSREKGGKQSSWIPTLSLLSGRLLDTISEKSTKTMTTSLNSQEMANLLWALATAQRATLDVFEHVSSSLVKNLPTQTNPQELSNSIWAYATSGLYGNGQETLLSFTAKALADDESFIRKWKTQECANCVWGIATIFNNKEDERSDIEDESALTIMRIVAAQLVKRADEFNSQEIANTVWAMATLGFGCSETSTTAQNDYICLHSNDLEGDRQLMEAALEAVQKSVLPRLHQLRSMELNNVAYAFSRLGQTDSSHDLYRGIAHEFSKPRRRLDGQDVGVTLWSFATAGYFEEESYRKILSNLNVNAAGTYLPRELSITVWALATAGVPVKYPDAFDTTLVPEKLRPSNWKDDPVTLCFALAAREVMRRTNQFKSQELKDTLWAFSKAGIRHPSFFKAMAEYLVGKESDIVPANQLHCGRGFDTFSPQSIGNVLWSYAKQAELAAETVKRVDGVTSSSTGKLFVLSTISLDIGESLVKRLFNACVETDLEKFDNLALLSPQDLSNTAWALSFLGLRHDRFFEAASRQIVERLSRGTDDCQSFKSLELSMLTWACSSMNYRFPQMLDAISPYVCQRCSLPNGGYNARSIAAYFKRQECGNLVWSCAVMEHYPPQLMELLYAGLVGNGDERDPEYLSQVFGDGGLQSQAIMTLLYVQMAIDMEWPSNDLILPEGFPDNGWDSAAKLQPADSELNMLSLSTSRMQSDVSKALDRIGFSHTEEHIISMDELVGNHGIKLSPKKDYEVLSIDIADVPDQVGIEVDGPGHFCSVLDTWSPQEEARGYAKMVNGKTVEYQFQWDDRHEMNGSTALKNRLLERLGWKILHVPFYQWDQVKGDSVKEDEYCTNLINEL